MTKIIRVNKCGECIHLYRGFNGVYCSLDGEARTIDDTGQSLNGARYQTTQPRRRRAVKRKLVTIAITAVCLLLLALMMACSIGGGCYSNYPGCAETMAAIETAAALP